MKKAEAKHLSMLLTMVSIPALRVDPAMIEFLTSPDMIEQRDFEFVVYHDVIKYIAMSSEDFLSSINDRVILFITESL